MTIKEFKMQYVLGSLSLADRTNLAINPKTYKTILRILSKDKNPSIIRLVAANPNTPIITLNKLSKHSSYTVKLSVAENPSTSEAVTKQLCKAHGWKYSRVLEVDPKAARRTKTWQEIKQWYYKLRHNEWEHDETKTALTILSICVIGGVITFITTGILVPILR